MRLQALPYAPETVTALLHALPHGADALALGHTLYQLALEDAAAGAGLAAARPVAWRFIAERAGEPIAIVETTLPNARSRVALLGLLGQGPATELLRGVERLEASAPQGDHEVRALHVPALCLSCLWLHSADEDLLLPYHGPSPSIPEELGTAGKLFTVIRRLAIKRRTADRKLPVEGTRPDASPKSAPRPPRRRAAGKRSKQRTSRRRPARADARS